MENLSPTLILLWDVKRSLEKGTSISVGIKYFLSRTAKSEFSSQVEQWWLSQNNAQICFNKDNLYMTRKYLLEILEAGLKGQSVLVTLKEYETGLIQSCEDEIQNRIAKLPLLLLIPLIGLIFPALMILLIGPLLNSLHF